MSTATPLICCKVAIIGGGIAGLGAAQTLDKCGIKDVIILEAQDYVGGRIKTEKHEGAVIEYGAQWLHGSQNELKQIADENKLISSVPSSEGLGQFLRVDGQEYDEKIVQTVDFVVGEILSRCEGLRDSADPLLSVGQYMCNEFNNRLHNLNEQDKLKFRELFLWHMKFQAIDNSCNSLYELSAARWGDYNYNSENSQSHINFNDGYSSLIEAIIRSIPNVRIILNKPVRNVIWKECTGRNNVQLACLDGSIYLAEYVICTVSLGCLKQNHRDMFIPNLPANLVNAIEHLGFGHIGKIFLQFENSWWGDKKGIQIVHDIENKEYEWHHDISGFDIVSVGIPNALLGWVSGEGARLMDSLPDSEVLHQCIRILERATKTTIPPVILFIKSAWSTNPYTCGSYSNIPVGCNIEGVRPSDLLSPVVSMDRPVLWFAGEAAHETHFSTTHGAYESGKQQASHIAKWIDHEHATN